MVYDSDFYTTRRPYRTSPSYSTYTTSKREIPWEKVPFVPRPSLVPDPITAFGKRPAKKEEEVQRPQRRSILDPEERAKIKPKAHLEPVKPYLTARDKTREKVFGDLIRKQLAPNEENMDVVLPRLHKVAECPDLPYKRKIVAYSDLPPSPRHYVVTDNPDRSRRAEEVYSYSYSSTSDSSSRSGDPYSRPKASSSSFSESVTRSSAGGPGGYSYTSERTSRSRGDGPGGYHSSYSSTSSGNLPGGTSYRHWSYRV